MKPVYRYIYISFLISLVTLVVLAVLYLFRFDNLKIYSAKLDRAYGVINTLYQTEHSVYALPTKMRGYIISKDSSFIYEFNYEMGRISLLTDSLKKIYSGVEDKVQYERVLRIERTIQRLIRQQQRTAEVAQRNDTAQLVFNIRDSRILMEEFNNELKTIQSSEIEKSEELLSQKLVYEKITPEFFQGILIVSIVITLTSFVVIMQQTRIRMQYQHELEQRIYELNNSTAELEQFTYVASHDLQEPLRKIRTFSNRLVSKHSNELPQEARQIVDRIDFSAKRMQELIADMVNFTNLVAKDENLTTVDLNYIISKVIQEYNHHDDEFHPVLHCENLPRIKGYPGKLFICFRSIIDNSVKFAKPGEHPLIRIMYKLVDETETGKPQEAQQYHRITIEDEGIGFEDEFADKIFMIFQRLHNQYSMYGGKGIGLAIAQRVVLNHKGFITAVGNPGIGTTIKIYFPAD